MKNIQLVSIIILLLFWVVSLNQTDQYKVIRLSDNKVYVVRELYGHEFEPGDTVYCVFTDKGVITNNIIPEKHYNYTLEKCVIR